MKKTTIITFARLLAIVFLIAIVFYFLCLHFRYSPWETIKEPAPLCEAGKTAVSKSRICYPPFLVPATERTEYAWDTGNNLLHRESIVEEIDEYLYEIGYINQLNDIVGGINGIPIRMAPYRFFIVSLEPTIVIMTDYDYGSIERKSIAGLCGKMNSQYIHYSKYLANGYHYGTLIPKMSSYKWFAPKYTKEIQNVTKEDGRFFIKTKTATLIFSDNEYGGLNGVTRQ